MLRHAGRRGRRPHRGTLHRRDGGQDQIRQVNGNEHDDRGGGGTCFGDSGGPGFGPTGNVVTVTSYGLTANFRYIDGLQRVDIPVVQDRLATFGVFPDQG